MRVDEVVDQLLRDGYWVGINCAPPSPAKIHEPVLNSYLVQAWTPPSGKDGGQSLVAQGEGGTLQEAARNLLRKLESMA